MPYSTVLIAILRLVFVFGIGTGLVRIIASLATIIVSRGGTFSWPSMGSALLQVAAGILLFFVAPLIARLAVGRRDGEIAPVGTTPHGIARAAIVGVGVYLIAIYLPLVINGLHQFTTPVAESVPWELDAQPSLYDLFEPLGVLSLGLLYILANARFAKYLCPKAKELPAG